MKLPFKPKLTSRSAVGVLVISVCCQLVGWLVILGWWFDLAYLKRVVPGFVTLFSVVAVVLSIVLTFITILWLNARAVHRLDAAREIAQQGLRRSEERLRLATEAMQMGTWDRDLLSNRLFWSPSMERMMGFAPGTFPGTYEAFAQLVHPEDRPRLMAAQQQARQNCGHYHAELRFILRDGQVRWGLVNGQIVCDAQGQPLRIVGVDIDITERKRAEEAQRQSELRYRELAESLPQLIWTCVADGLCDYLSPQWVAYTGVSASVQLGFGWLNQLHPDDRATVAQQWETAKAKGDVFDEEFRIRRADGVYHWFRTRAVPIYDERGRVLKWFGSNTDIEDIKQAQEKIERLNAELEKRVAHRTEELAAANRELEAFAYSVSHDLRAPLRAIDGFSRILVEDYATELTEEATEYLQLVRENTQRMGRLIDDLLNFSRLNRQTFNRQLLDPGDLVRAVLAELEHERRGRQVELSIEEMPLCSADATLLKQVYVNLLTNAFKFTQQCTIARIHIGARQTGAAVPIYFVQDNGVGFDMKYSHKLFQVFQRLHRAEDYEGTGVGLAIVQRIIQRHNGRIWAEGAPNAGATFYFTLAGGAEG
ncbi:MAG: PAS domain-containing protein [Blastocatellia bacterium]